MVHARKKVDNAIGPINVIFQTILVSKNLGYNVLKYFGQTSGLYPSSLFFEHILCPQSYKSQLLEFLTNIVNIGPTITI